jgi:hypothetical protein
VILQGRLVAGDTLADAGITAQIRVQPPEPAAEAAA